MAKSFTVEQVQLAAEIIAAYLAAGGNASQTAINIGRNRCTVQRYLADWRAGNFSQFESVPTYTEIPDKRTQPSPQPPTVQAQAAPLLQNVITSEQVATPEWMGALLDWCSENNIPPPVLPGLPVAEAERPAAGTGALVKAPAGFGRVAFLSDIHVPYESKLGVQAMLGYLADWKPDLTVMCGDIWDCYEISDHAKDPARWKTLQDEFDEGKYLLKAVDEVSREVVFIQGNHEERLTRLISANRGLFKLRSLDFPVAASLPSRWKYYPDQTHYRIGGLSLLHGNLKGRGGSSANPAAAMLKKMRTSCLFGHWHRFGSAFETGYDGTIRGGFANGHLADVDAAGSYIRCPDWQSGFTTIEFSNDYAVWSVRQHIIVNGRFVADGREWSL